MKADVKNALADWLLAMGDDELILGHRDSEWCGHAPILEEDIAFANIALDELGHAVVWYRLLAELIGENPETYPDQLVYRRDSADFRNTQFVELPKSDWAVTMMRQYLFDTAESVRLEHLQQSGYEPLAAASAKIRKEEVYHLRHTRAWVQRLGLGTDESRRRMQTALDVLWPYALQLFEPLPGESALVEAAYRRASESLRSEWESQVLPFLTESGLATLMESEPSVARGDLHTDHLAALLDELHEVVRQHPNAKW